MLSPYKIYIIIYFFNSYIHSIYFSSVNFGSNSSEIDSSDNNQYISSVNALFYVTLTDFLDSDNDDSFYHFKDIFQSLFFEVLISVEIHIILSLF